MSAGIIDHEAGTRDIPRLGGLRRLMPVTFVIATLASLSMAGIPFFNGFLSKEMMLEETTHTVLFGIPLLVPLLAVIGALFSAAYSFRYIAHVFLGPERDDYPHHPHDPGFGFWAPPALLVLAVVVIGVAPFLAEPLVKMVTSAVLGGTAELPDVHLAIWHGITPALWMSVVAVTGGVVLLLSFAPLSRAWASSGPPAAKPIYDAIIAALVGIARVITGRLHDGSLTRYAAIFGTTVVIVGTYAWMTGAVGPQTRVTTPVTLIPLVGWALLVMATGVLVYNHRNRFFTLILMGVVGLMISVGFAYLSAPDLALTQLSVEVVTVILLLLALNFLPRETPIESSAGRRLRDAVISLAAGVGAGALVYGMLIRDFPQGTISGYHLENSYYGGGGTNVVNVILVDFRGFDTFGEIIVLGIAALIIYAITEALLSSPVRARLLNRPDEDVAGDSHPLMMVVVTRVMMPLVLLVGVYIFLRGHNEPGGGFIAGLIVSIGVVMQYMASGFSWANARQHYPYHAIIGFGVLVAWLTGIGAWFFGAEFLASSFGYFRIPPFEEFELATAMGFDLGVFLCVLGAVMLSLESFSRLSWRSGMEVSQYPMDIDPSREDETADAPAGKES
jgi:multicomponent K+:H+ antiporter subunit A